MEEVLTKVLYEKLLIQYMFKDEVVRDRLVPYLNPDVFMNHQNSKLVEAIVSFSSKHDHFPKINELKLFIKETETYENLLEIMDVDSSEYDRDFILSELEEFYRKSLVANVLIETQENLNKDTEKLQEYPDKLREAMSFCFDTGIGLSFMDDPIKMYDALHNKDVVTPTGLKSLDDLIEGGLHPKTLNVVMAQSGLGKTLTMCSIASDVLMKNKNVLYISLEMSEEKLSERILTNLFDLEKQHLQMLDREKFIKKHALIKKQLKSNLVIVQRGAKTVNANKIRQILKDLKVKKNFVPHLIVVDYLGLMTTNGKVKDGNSYSEQKVISEELRCVFVEEDIIGLTAVQTNRSGFNVSELDMTSIADSIGIVATADLLVGLTATDELKAEGKLIMSILKNRYGEVGRKIFVGVSYTKMRLYDINEDSTPVIKDTLLDAAAEGVLNTLKTNKAVKKSKIVGIE